MALGDYMGAQCHACIGGTSVREDMRKLDDGVHVVVGKFQLLSWFTSCLTVIVNAKLNSLGVLFSNIPSLGPTTW